MSKTTPNWISLVAVLTMACGGSTKPGPQPVNPSNDQAAQPVAPEADDDNAVPEDDWDDHDEDGSDDGFAEEDDDFADEEDLLEDEDMEDPDGVE